METINRKARFNYEIIDELEAGIELKQRCRPLEMGLWVGFFTDFFKFSR